MDEPNETEAAPVATDADPKETERLNRETMRHNTETLKISLHQIAERFKEHYFKTPDNLVRIGVAQKFTVTIKPGEGFEFEGSDL